MAMICGQCGATLDQLRPLYEKAITGLEAALIQGNRFKTALQDIVDYAEGVAAAPNADQLWVSRELLEPVRRMARLVLDGGK